MTPIVHTLLEMIAIEGGIPYHTAAKTVIVYTSDIRVTDGGEMVILAGASARFGSGCSPRLRSRLRDNRDALVEFFRQFREAETRLDDIIGTPVVGSSTVSKPICPIREGAAQGECHAKKLGFPFGYVYSRTGLREVVDAAEDGEGDESQEPRKLSAASVGCGGEGNFVNQKQQEEK